MTHPYRSNQTSSARRASQGGMALIVTLMILVIVTLLSVSASRNATQGEFLARANRAQQVAFWAAESAIRDARLDLSINGDAPRSVRDILAKQATDGPSSSSATCNTKTEAAAPKGAHVAGCNPGDAVLRGLCAQNEQPMTAWLATLTTAGVTRGQFARPDGLSAPDPFVGAGIAGVAAQPIYVVERLDPAIGEAINQCRPVYRITARGFGPTAQTVITLQETYQRR